MDIFFLIKAVETFAKDLTFEIDFLISIQIVFRVLTIGVYFYHVTVFLCYTINSNLIVSFVYFFFLLTWIVCFYFFLFY